MAPVSTSPVREGFPQPAGVKTDSNDHRSSSSGIDERNAGATHRLRLVKEHMSGTDDFIAKLAQGNLNVAGKYTHIGTARSDVPLANQHVAPNSIPQTFVPSRLPSTWPSYSTC